MDGEPNGYSNYNSNCNNNMVWNVIYYLLTYKTEKPYLKLYNPYPKTGSILTY